MVILYLSIFLLIYTIFTNNTKNILDEFVIVGVFLFLVVSKVSADIINLPDLDNYFDGYTELSMVDWMEVPVFNLTSLKCPEVGFRYVLKAGSWLGDFKWTLLIVSMIHTFAYVLLAKKYSPYVMISLIMFLLGSIQSYFVLRQHLAIAITILSYPYIINRNWQKFSFAMLLAFSFHQTALVFIPVYFLYGIKKQKYLNILLVMTLALLMFLFSSILNHFTSFLIGYESYMDSNEANTTTILISAGYLFSYMYCLKENIYTNGIERLVFILLVVNFIMLTANYAFTGINRLMMYYTVGNILSVPITMKYIRQPLVRYTFCGAILLMLSFLFCYGSNSEYLEFV